MGSLQNYYGELAALATALCWAVTSTSFEHSAKKIGSMNLNLWRLFIGLVFLSIFTGLTRGHWFPTDATQSEWFWLLLSGLVGIVIGDLLLFEAFVLIGSRISMLIYASVPPLSGIMALIFLGEKMTLLQVIGMMITLAGIASVILVTEKGSNKVGFSHPIMGILLAFGGAFGQAAGYIIGKFGMSNYDPFAATQIRLLAGIAGFVVIFTLKGHWPKFKASFKRRDALLSLTMGSFFGPFLGISLSLYAVQKINPGVASTLIAITPILLIPYAFFVKHEKVTAKEVIGTGIALIGIGVMFL
ncbi:DMT family transporter [Fusibacter ferrireducens]|uniref:DMT family transporter n=1 Tax=Fusibacter ferrireducens TaxID=2785058 RepID=A0ABR9ZWV3_9FIRM|nr:DMT family transporter [Fusibacter ferrireducens]MBF4694948.1 DMT family transporter [Fusibacter ferrireducens]